MATPPGKVPIAESAAAGLKFVTDNWRRLLPSAFLLGLTYGVYYWSASYANNAPEREPLFLLASLVMLTLTILVGASYYRLALRNEFSGFSGLRVGADEGRYLGVTLWMALPIAGIMLAMGVVLYPTLDGAAKKSGYTLQQLAADPAITQAVLKESGAAALLIVLTGVLILIWLALRLCLAVPATLESKRIALWSTLPWTKGNVWRIVAAFALLLAPISILAAVLQSLFSLMLDVNPSEAQSGIAAATPALAAYGFVYGFTSAFLAVAPVIGLVSYLYKGLRPPSA